MQRNGNPRVSVVVPTRNEARNLEVVLPAIAAVRPAVHEIIVVDGHSVDGSIETAQRVLPWVRAISQTRKGKGNAMACGFAAATGDVIVMFDADGSADPAEIPAFVSALVAGADFAKGSRFAPGGGSDDITLLRRSGNAGLNGVANALFGTSYTDLCYGYNAFWADLLPLLDLPDPATPAPADGMLWGDGFEIETVLNCRVAAAGLRITEVPSVERQRILRVDEPADLRRRHPCAAHAGRGAAPGGAAAGPRCRAARAAVRGGRCAVIRARRVRLRLLRPRHLRRRWLRRHRLRAPRDTRTSWTSPPGVHSGGGHSGDAARAVGRPRRRRCRAFSAVAGSAARALGHRGGHPGEP